MDRYQNQPQPQNPRPYAERYRRDGNVILDHVFNAGPYILAFISFLIVLLSLAGLVLMDVVAGKYTGEYMAPTGGRILGIDFDWWWTFATTGIPLALIGFAMYAWRDQWNWRVVTGIILVALIPVGIDVRFDMMSADLIRYGHYIEITTLVGIEREMHTWFRYGMGLTSLLGEPVGAASVIIFPVMRNLFKGVFSS
jgi:hypothetical protein